MMCFNHADHQAVGVCKSCQRGLCHDCAVDLGKGLACKNRCEEDVRQLIQVIDQSIRLRPTSTYLLTRSRQTRIATAVFYFAMGALFIGWGFSRSYMHVIAGFGFLLVGYGVYLLTQLPKPTTSDTSEKPNE